MIFTTQGFLEVTVQSWLEWDFNPQPLNSVQTLLPTGLSRREFNSHSEPIFPGYSNFIYLFGIHITFWPFPSSVATFVLS